MGTHKSAWNGLTILVFDAEPLVAMKIEQSIAMVAPWLETLVESFEVYEDALAYCRQRRDVGFFLIADHCPGRGSAEVFRDLAGSYESATGWPAAGVLHGNDGPCLEASRAMSAELRLLDYNEKSRILDICALPSVLEQIWTRYISFVESTIVPDGVWSGLRSLAEESEADRISHAFMQRTAERLVASLNLSWQDMLGVKWALAFYAFHVQRLEALGASRELRRLVEVIGEDLRSKRASIGNASDAVVDVCFDRTMSLAGRLAVAIAMLCVERNSGRLDACLAAVVAAAEPGSPGLLRAIGRCVDAIAGDDVQDTKFRVGNLVDKAG